MLPLWQKELSITAFAFLRMRSDSEETREIPVIPDDSEFVRLIKMYSAPAAQPVDKVESRNTGSDLLTWIVFWTAVFFAYVVSGLIAGFLLLEVFKRLP